MLKKFALIHNEANDAQGGAAESKVEGTPTSKTTAAPVQAEGNTDDFGYATDAAQEGASNKEAAPAQESKPTTTETTKLTGYGDEPPKVEEVKPPVEEPKSVKEYLGYELDLKGLEKTEAEKITAFAKANKLSEETAKAFLDLKKSEIAADLKLKADQEAQTQKEIAALKSSWDSELRNDPYFGKEKFAHNVQKVEKVLNEFMGETKNMLTERKSMLPPYVMRDLAKLADHLYSTEKLVQGEAAKSSEEKHFLEELYG